MIGGKIVLKCFGIPCWACSDPVGDNLLALRVPFSEKSGPDHVNVTCRSIGIMGLEVLW